MSLFKDYFLGSLLYQRTHGAGNGGGRAVAEPRFLSFSKEKKVKCPSDYIHCSVSYTFGIRFLTGQHLPLALVLSLNH